MSQKSGLYYVVAIQGKQTVPLVGPFVDDPDAANRVQDRARRTAIGADLRMAWSDFRVVRLPATLEGAPVGRFNAEFFDDDLLDDALRSVLPPLGATRQRPLDRVPVQARFHSQDSGWTWYPVEGQPVRDGGEERDFRFYGLISGPSPGTDRMDGFLLSELCAAVGPRGIPVRRDPDFRPESLAALCERLSVIDTAAPLVVVGASPR